MTTIRMTGHDAIRYAAAHSLALSTYTDPTAEAREGVSVEEARSIAREDPSLVYLDVAIRITHPTTDGATVSIGRRPGVPLTWQTMRDAATQDDGSLATVYRAVLTEARHAAKGLMAQRWVAAGEWLGTLGDTSEAERDRLVALAAADGYTLGASSVQLVTLDPDLTVQAVHVAGVPIAGTPVAGTPVAGTPTLENP